MTTGTPTRFPASQSRFATRATSRRWDVFVGGVMLTLVLAYFASGLLASFVVQHRTAPGLVPVSAVIDGAEVVAMPTATRGLSTYSVLVHCHYAWQGEEHFSVLASWAGGGSRMDLRDATDAAAAFEPAAPLEVFVDPAQPAHAVLDDRAPRSVVPVVLLMLLTAGSAFLALIGWRGWPLSAPAAHR